MFVEGFRFDFDHFEISASKFVMCLCTQLRMCDYHLEQVRNSTQSIWQKTSGFLLSLPLHLVSSSLSCFGVPSQRLATTTASLSSGIPACWSLNEGVRSAFENAAEVPLLPA